MKKTKVIVTFEVEGYSEEELKALTLTMSAYDLTCLAPNEYGLELEGNEGKCLSMTVEAPSFIHSFEDIRNKALQ